MIFSALHVLDLAILVHLGGPHQVGRGTVGYTVVRWHSRGCCVAGSFVFSERGQGGWRVQGGRGGCV